MTAKKKAPMVDEGFIGKGPRHRPIRTHCVRGHERTPGNLTPSRSCRICRNENRPKPAPIGDRLPADVREAMRYENNAAGLARLMARRRAKGIPEEGLRVE